MVSEHLCGARCDQPYVHTCVVRVGVLSTVCEHQLPYSFLCSDRTIPPSHYLSGIGLARWPDIPLHGGVAQGFLLIPVSGVDAAEGRGREQVGEEKFARNGRNGTSMRDMIRDRMILRNTHTLDNLEPHVQSSPVRCAREKCACACVR